MHIDSAANFAAAEVCLYTIATQSTVDGVTAAALTLFSHCRAFLPLVSSRMPWATRHRTIVPASDTVAPVEQ